MSRRTRARWRARRAHLEAVVIAAEARGDVDEAEQARVALEDHHWGRGPWHRSSWDALVQGVCDVVSRHDQEVERAAMDAAVESLGRRQPLPGPAELFTPRTPTAEEMPTRWAG